MIEPSSEFLGVYAPVFQILERFNLGRHYALIGGYGVKFWHNYYLSSNLNYLQSNDIDLRGNKHPVAVKLRDFWPARMQRARPHMDNPDSVTFVLKNRTDVQKTAKAEVIKRAPTLDLHAGRNLQRIAYRLSYRYDEKLTVSVLDPCSLFVSKYPAFLDPQRRKDPRKHDGRHLELLAEIIPQFLTDASQLEQARKPSRDPRIAAQRLLSALEPPRELPAGIDREALLSSLRVFVGTGIPTHYTEPTL